MCTQLKYCIFSDVVVAYKSLLKEKEALEVSLASLTSRKTAPDSAPNESVSTSAQETINALSNSSKSHEIDQLRMQISTLMNSLATLSAEKSKMEASFREDRKTARNELKLKGYQ